MAEVFDLAKPITPVAPTTSTLRVRSVILAWDERYITIVLRDNNNVESVYNYHDTAATNLMIALNKANLSVKSLHKRILEQLVLDGKLASGSVSGSPD